MVNKNLVLGWFLNIFSLAFLIGCKDKSPKSENEKTRTNVADSSAPVWGRFEGLLPCADCNGIQTRIFLQKDFTYIKEENYKGVSDTMTHIFYDLGKWTLKDSLITLTGMTSDTLHYKLLPDLSIQMLGEDEKPQPDSVAAQYHFVANGKTFQTEKPFLVSGVLDKTDNKFSFYVCVWNTTENIAFSGKSKAQLDSLLHSLKKPDATKAIVQGEVLLDPNTPNKFVFQKIISAIDGDNCN